MVQQELVNALVGSFFNMLFSNDTQANTQKQKMMEELKARQAEAERQKQVEEAIRLEQICKQLQGTLKLTGTPDLKLKTEISENRGLQLKMSDQSDSDTENCDNKFLNGISFYVVPAEKLKSLGLKPCARKSDTPLQQGGLALKVGRDTQAPPATAATAADPRTMTPQQLADMAQNLTPQQQKELSNAMQAAQNVHGSGTVVGAGAATSTTDTPATPASGSPESQSPTPGSPFDQLHRIAASVPTSGAAEVLASKAREGFDTAGSGAVNLPSIDPSKPAPFATPQPPASDVPPAQGRPSSHATGEANLHPDFSASVVPVSGGPILDVAPPPPPPSRIPKMSDEELRTQTCRTRKMMTDIGRNSMKDSSEMDAIAKEVEDTRQEAVQAGIKCFSDMLEKYLDTKLGSAVAGSSTGAEKEARESLLKIMTLERDIDVTVMDYKISKQKRDEKLDAALGILDGVYSFLQKTEGVPWVATTKCMIDFGYVAGKIYVEQQQIDTMNRNLDNSAGALKAESVVGAFYKNLVDEALRRGMGPATFCEEK